mmetsp:Transcript_13727/g.51194  ORF Transcript_13727/g.51194 Transcript_13727/m.51194 type:complete len:243 (+) Transcript_13727:983-1711(+)
MDFARLAACSVKDRTEQESRGKERTPKERKGKERKAFRRPVALASDRAARPVVPSPHHTTLPRRRGLGGERHDGVHDVVAGVFLQGLHGALSGHVGLVHDKSDVCVLEARLVHLLVVIVVVLILLGGARAEPLRYLLRKLRRCVLLCLRRRVVQLGLAEDDVGLRGRRLVHVRIGDGKDDVLALLDGHAHDVRHGAHAQLLHRLARLLLTTICLYAPQHGLVILLIHIRLILLDLLYHRLLL